MNYHILNHVTPFYLIILPLCHFCSKTISPNDLCDECIYVYRYMCTGPEEDIKYPGLSLGLFPWDRISPWTEPHLWPWLARELPGTTCLLTMSITFMWILGIRAQILTHARQVFLPTEPSSKPLLVLWPGYSLSLFWVPKSPTSPSTDFWLPKPWELIFAN